MGRAAIAKTRILILGGIDARRMSKIAGADGEMINYHCNDPECRSGAIKDSSCWVPHPKSGIYFPKGHEWVMNDVPDSAASLGSTFWLRSVDGVEKPNADDARHQLPTHR